MEWVRQGASINCVNTISNNTPLHLAANKGYPRMAKWLMENGADHTARDTFYNKWTPAQVSNRVGDGSVARVIEEFLKR